MKHTRRLDLRSLRQWRRARWFAARVASTTGLNFDPFDIHIGWYADRVEPRFNLVCVMISRFGSFYGHDYRSALKSIRYYIRTDRYLEPVWMRYVDEVSFTDLPTNGAQ